MPVEPAEKWPTHINIKEPLDDIHDKATSRYVFLFCFAGHGVLLYQTASSPADGRSKDPPVRIADYCRGELAIRGWELN
jgi:hypothetical protein